jgi:hypothetical protein
MADLTFPISYKPKPPWKAVPDDNTLRSQMDDGLEITRKKFTKGMMNLTDVVWDITDDTYLELINFYNNTTNGGSLSFNLVIETETITLSYVVRFTKPPEFTYQGIGVWEALCSFREFKL